MALQTETHSTTPTPSSTSTGSAPDPTSTESDNSSGFSLKGSPPLILAFLAVGMFAIAMIVFFGWRRRDRWANPPTAPTPGVGAPPKLWDVWSPHERAREGNSAEWKNIQPLAATIWDDTPVPVLVNHDLPDHDTMLAAAFAHMRRRYRHHRSHENIAMDAKLAQPLVRLQIAVTIAMPSPDFAGTSSRTEPDDDLLDYSIGLHEIPWKKTDLSV